MEPRHYITTTNMNVDRHAYHRRGGVQRSYGFALSSKGELIRALNSRGMAGGTPYYNFDHAEVVELDTPFLQQTHALLTLMEEAEAVRTVYAHTPEAVA